MRLVKKEFRTRYLTMVYCSKADLPCVCKSTMLLDASDYDSCVGVESQTSRMVAFLDFEGEREKDFS